MTTPDVPHRMEVELSIDAPADVVWEAIATASGISSWMMPADLDPRVGGDVVFHMGPEFDSTGRVTAFEAPRRFAYEEDWATLAGHAGADVTPLATEFLVEAHAGGTCTVRIVTSAFGTGADWEHEFYDEMEAGWGPMLDNLRLYVESYPGQTATTMWAEAVTPVRPEAAIDAVRARLGVREVGDATDARGITAVVERSLPRHVLLRVAAPVGGFVSFFSGGGDAESAIHLSGQLFGPGATSYVDAELAEWQRWLDELVAGLR